jgi:hypothetical protein
MRLGSWIFVSQQYEPLAPAFSLTALIECKPINPVEI